MGGYSACYARMQDRWFIKLGGDIRHPLGPALNTLLDQAFAAPDTARFLVDLSETETIDSTCLGVLARIANWSTDHAAPQPVIVSTNGDITAVLRAICFDRLFDLRDEPVDTPATWSDIAPHETGIAQLSDTILEAHRRLCAIGETNEEAFRGVVEALERETGRH